MKLGVIVSMRDDVRKKFRELSEMGFSTCQLSCWNPDLFTDENAEIINRAKEAYHIEISAFWCGWEGPRDWNFYTGQLTLGLVPPEYRAMRVKNLCDGADFAKKLGITDVVTHMGFIPENPYDPNFSGFCVAYPVRSLDVLPTMSMVQTSFMLTMVYQPKSSWNSSTSLNR